jgi:hypothetical protein
MVLEADHSLAGVGAVGIGRAMIGRPAQFPAIMEDDPVKNNGHVRGFGEIAAAIKTGCFEHNVVGVPFAGCLDGVRHGRPLAVKSTHLTIGICTIVVGIEDLDLEFAVKVNAAVASALAIAFHDGRRGEFEVKLTIAKLLPGLNRAGLRRDFHKPILNLPTHRATFRTLPPGGIHAIEQLDGIRGRWSAMAKIGSRSHHGRNGTIRVMNVPFLAPDDWGIGVSDARA